MQPSDPKFRKNADPRSHAPHHSLQPLSPEEHLPVPVYDCRVYVAPPDDAGRVRARVATLADLSVEAGSEREALQAIVRLFKMTVVKYRERDEEIPWLDPPLEPTSHEQTRWLAVHL
jgi:hypothetical protein